MNRRQLPKLGFSDGDQPIPPKAGSPRNGEKEDDKSDFFFFLTGRRGPISRFDTVTNMGGP